jgi:hypothetical protein
VDTPTSGAPEKASITITYDPRTETITPSTVGHIPADKLVNFLVLCVLDLGRQQLLNAERLRQMAAQRGLVLSDGTPAAAVLR